MGVAIDGDYAVVWFGKDPDPVGPIPTTYTSEAEAAYAGLTLSAKIGTPRGRRSSSS